MEAQEKFHSNSSSFRPINSSSFSMYDLNQYADVRSDNVRPITGRNSQASSMSTSPSWQQFGTSTNTSSSLLMPALPAPFKRPAPIQKPTKTTISLDAFQYPSAATNQQLLNYYYAQLQQQQQQQRQAALIQQQLQYQQLQQQQRLLWEQTRYSSMMSQPHRSQIMSRSATTDALASSASSNSTFADYAMLSSLAAVSSSAASSNSASHQLPRSNTLFTSRNNHI